MGISAVVAFISFSPCPCCTVIGLVCVCAHVAGMEACGCEWRMDGGAGLVLCLASHVQVPAMAGSLEPSLHKLRLTTHDSSNMTFLGWYAALL